MTALRKILDFVSVDKMRPIQKIRSILVFFILILVIGGCSRGSKQGSQFREWMGQGPEMRVLTSIAQIEDLVSKIGGERVRSLALVRGDLDPHSYELVKGDDEKFIRADLIFFNGLNLEHGASLSELLHTSSKAVSIGDFIAKTHPEKILQAEGVVDPHLWMDVSLWSLSIDPIVEALSQKDPEGRVYYRERGSALKEEMDLVHHSIQQRMRKIPQDKRYLLTTHDAFRYFARGYLAEEGELNWEERFAAPEGLAPDGQITPSDIQAMVTFLKQHQVSVLFPESNLSKDSIQKIADSGCKLGLNVRVCHETLYGDSMSSLSYLEMMKKNGEIMARYLE